MGNCMETEKVEGRSRASLEKTSLRNNLVHKTQNRNVFDYYEVLSVLGEGSMGAVSSVRKKDTAVGGSAYKSKKMKFIGKRSAAPSHVVKGSTKKKYALKSIIMSRVSKEFIDELRNEIDILRTLDHPNIVRAYEVYETQRNLYVVMEICSGGDLYTRGPYSEKEAAKIVGKLLSAIAYMHANNVVHRDLKFENIMFESSAADAEIKLIDFGLSKKYSPGQKYMKEGVGTIYTMAPQVLQGVYTSKADLWSVGVISYMLLSSTKPFGGKKRKVMIDKIMRCDYNFNGRRWQGISIESQKFVAGLLQLDPQKRFDAEEALHHKWLQRQFRLSDRIPNQNFMDDVHENIANFGSVSEFKKMALMVIAHKSSTDEILELRKAFDAIDTENNGSISYDEFQAALKKSNSKYTESETKDMFDTLDDDKNGIIYYTEFLAATLEVHGRIVEERLADAFDRIDSDDSGYISKKNIVEILGKDYSEKKVEMLFQHADLDMDGKISFDDFLNAFRLENSNELETLYTRERSRSEDRSLVGIDTFIPGGKYDT